MKKQKLREAHEELEKATEKIEDLRSKFDALRVGAYYMAGVIEGLKFATKCNGVSGAEIDKEPEDDDATHVTLF